MADLPPVATDEINTNIDDLLGDLDGDSPVKQPTTPSTTTDTAAAETAKRKRTLTSFFRSSSPAANSTAANEGAVVDDDPPWLTVEVHEARLRGRRAKAKKQDGSPRGGAIDAGTPSPRTRGGAAASKGNGGSSGAYAKIRLVAPSGRVARECKTKVVTGTHPAWNVSVDFKGCASLGPGHALVVTVKDAGGAAAGTTDGKGGDALGTVSVPLADVLALPGRSDARRPSSFCRTLVFRDRARCKCTAGERPGASFLLPSGSPRFN